MRISVSFEPIRAATREADEEARLVFANERLVALLVPAREGWFLQVGLGPCEREGLLFGNLGGAEAWVRACLATCPAEQERRAEPLV